MRIIGIIAEYNPLHSGHVYHMQEAKEAVGADYCVVVMSGNFVQRGEPACADKYTRAEWAVRSGADLVLELPTVYAVSPAERFALGGVRTLMATGIITDLAFGCEDHEIETLYALTQVLTEEPPAFRKALRAHMSLGKSYPRARYDALAQLGTEERLLQALAKPNNILAIEYLRAIGKYAPDIHPLPIKRTGSSYHDESLAGEFASATAIRKALKGKDPRVLQYTPSFVGGALIYDPTLPIVQEQLESMILYALRRLGQNGIAEVPDVAEGLENLIWRSLNHASCWQEVLDEVKSKRFTMARLKRIGINALLGIDNSLVHDTIRSNESEYLKVLAMSRSGRDVLSRIALRSSVRPLLRNADQITCPEIVRRNLEIDSLSTDAIAFASGREIHRDSDGPLIL